MNRDEVWQTIDTERAAFADLLDDLSADEWQAASLCAGWRVRDVAAHLTLAQMGWLPAVRGFARARGGFNRTIHDTAVRQAAAVPAARFAPMIRGMVGSRRKAPVVTDLEPLIDILVHTQDVLLPLGRTRAVPPAAAAVAATRAYTMSWPFQVRRRLAGLRLVATDHPWAIGAGEVVEGPMAALLLLVTGRTAAVPQLSGPGVAVLRG